MNSNNSPYRESEQEIQAKLVLEAENLLIQLQQEYHQMTIVINAHRNRLYFLRENFNKLIGKS